MSPNTLLNRNHSSRLWHSFTIIIATLMLLLLNSPSVSASSLGAGDDGNAGSSVVALDVLCVEGLVINHQEQPLSGWTITATYVGAEGPADPQIDVSGGKGKFSFDLPAPGRWLFSLSLPSDWVALTDASFETDIVYGSTDCIRIRFKVEQQIEVIVIKIDDDHHPLVGWTIIATPGPGNTFSEIHEEVTDEEGRATFTLSPGLWIFSERAPDDVTWWRPIMPPDGVQELVVASPGPYTIRFKNDVKIVKNGCIEVIKQDVAPLNEDGTQGESFGLPDWPIRVLRANGSVAAAGETDAFGHILFSDLPFGPYVVQELMLDGWEAVSPTRYEVVLTRDDDGCQVITFKNKQKERGFCIEGRKTDLNESYGIPGWEIDATPLDAGGIDPAPVLTDGQGQFRIDFPLDDYRVPGSRYEVCEETRDGWTAVTPSCQTVTLPKYPGNCQVITPPFINRQTNDSHPTPHSDGGHQGHPNQHSSQPKYNPKPWVQDRGSCSAYHTVQRGESIYSIAPKYGMSGASLMQANSWVRGQRNNWVFVGQQVCIP